jgi:hypothetical protein
VIAVRTALIALLALLIAAAPAAAAEQPPRVKAVYRDYRDDGVIDACKHERAALKETLDDLPDSADLETPDLRPALEAAIEQHKDGDCKDAGGGNGSSAGSAGTGSSGTTGASTVAPSATVAPPVTGEGAPSSSINPPVNTPDSSITAPRTIAPKPSATPKPPTAQDVTPVPSATPAPTPVPAPAEPSGPVATPTLVYSNPDDDLPPVLLVVAAAALLLALLGLLYALAARTGRLAGPRRSAREAAFRLGGTWGDFADWLRTGR